MHSVVCKRKKVLPRLLRPGNYFLSHDFSSWRVLLDRLDAGLCTRNCFIAFSTIGNRRPLEPPISSGIHPLHLVDFKFAAISRSSYILLETYIIVDYIIISLAVMYNLDNEWL